jgi:hypothetical protein
LPPGTGPDSLALADSLARADSLAIRRWLAVAESIAAPEPGLGDTTDAPGIVISPPPEGKQE